MRRLASRSLARRMVISVLLGLGLILTIFGLVSMWTVEQMVQSVYRERLLLARTVAGHVDDIFRYSMGELRWAAQSLAVDPAGQMDESQKEALRRSSRDIGSFATIVLVGERRQILWSDPPDAPVGPDLLNHVALIAALENGVGQTGELASALGDGSTLAFLAVPIKDTSDHVRAVLLAEVDPRDKLLSLIPGSEIEQATSVSLMNATGAIVAGTPLEPRDVAAHQMLLLRQIELAVPAVATHEARDHRASHLVAYAPVASMPSWGVVVEQPKDMALAASQDLQNRLILAGVIALVAAVSFAWLDARRVTRPLKALAAVAERFSTGQLDQPVSVQREDEVGALTRAFEGMRQELKRSRDEIEAYNRELAERVQLRTREVEERNRQLTATNEIAATVSRSLQTDEILDHALRRVLDVTGLDQGSFLLRKDGDDGLRDERDTIESPLSGQKCRGDCLCAQAMRTGVPAVAQDIGVVCNATACQKAGLECVVAVPLCAREHVLGVLFLGSRQKRSFGQRDIDTLSAIGQQIGMALANARLYEEVQTREQARVHLIEQIITAQEGERQRIARDLHDSTGQSLSVIIMGLEALEEPDSCDPSLLTPRVKRTREVAKRALIELRELVFDLRPIVLDDLGLVSALHVYADRHLGEKGVHVSFESVGMKERLPSQLETALFRVLQETINNVSRHAQATVVRISLLRSESDFTAVVEDDGVGFNPDAMRRPTRSDGGLGLLGIRERIDMLGGSVEIRAAPGAGTRVVVHLSLSNFEGGVA